MRYPPIAIRNAAILMMMAWLVACSSENGKGSRRNPLHVRVLGKTDLSADQLFLQACWKDTGCDPSRGGSSFDAKPILISAQACGAAPGQPDARAAIQKVIDIASCESKGPDASASVHLVFDNGVYNIGWDATQRQELHALIIKDSRNLVLDGHGATFLFKNPSAGAMHVMHNKNLTIKNLVYDYATTPFTQGTVTELNSAMGYFVINVDPGFPAPDDASLFRNAAMSLDPDRFITDSAFAFVAETPMGVRLGMGAIWLPQRRTCSQMAERIGQTSQFRIYPRGKTGLNCDSPDDVAGASGNADLATLFRNNRLEVGSRVVLLARSSQFGTVDFLENDTVSIDEVTIYASAGGTHFGWEHNDGKIDARHVRFLVKPASNRLITANGDGFNTNRANRATFAITDSVFEKLGDDVINLNTFGVELAPGVVEGNGAILRFPTSVPWYQKHFAANDALTFVHLKTGQKILTTHPVVVDRVEPICQANGAIWDANAICVYVKLGDAYSPIPTVTEGDAMLFNESVASQGSVFSHNVIKTPRGGVTVSSPGSKILNNTATVVSWFAQIPLDMAWRQGPIPHDIEVSGNNIAVADPKSFTLPAVIYSFQRGTESTGPYRTSDKMVTDIYGLRIFGNAVANTGSTVMPVKTRNARPAAGATFILQEDDGENASPVGPRTFHKANDSYHYCTFDTVSAFHAAGGSDNDPYLTFIPLIMQDDGRCP